MKTLAKLLALLLVIASAPLLATAQESTKEMPQQMIEHISKTPNIGFAVKTEKALRGALGNYKRLKENKVPIEHFEVVIAGKILKDISRNQKLYSLVEAQLQQKDFKITVCAVAMKNLRLHLEDLPNGVEMTPTYSLRILELQALGYNMIIP